MSATLYSDEQQARQAALVKRISKKIHFYEWPVIFQTAQDPPGPEIKTTFYCVEEEGLPMKQMVLVAVYEHGALVKPPEADDHEQRSCDHEKRSTSHQVNPYDR